MDAHVGIVGQMLDEIAESFLTERNVLVVGVVVAAKNEIYRLEIELFLQLKLEIERIKWVFLLSSKHQMSFADTVTVACRQILDKAAHGAIQSFVLVGPCCIYVIRRDKTEPRFLYGKVGICRL